MTKLGFGGLHWNVSVKFNFDSYRSNTAATEYETRIKLHNFPQKGLVSKTGLLQHKYRCNYAVRLLLKEYLNTVYET